MSATHFILEGTWTGYRPEQRRVVHRAVYGADHADLRAWVDEGAGQIVFTDGTSLLLSTRDIGPKEPVKAIDTYADLITQCFRARVNSVDALLAAKRRPPPTAPAATNAEA